MEKAGMAESISESDASSGSPMKDTVEDQKPLEFIRKLKDQHVEEKPCTVVFECELNKMSAVQWFYNNHQIISSDKYVVLDKGHIHTLRIMDVCDKDEGKYCVTVNGQKSDASIIIEETDEEKELLDIARRFNELGARNGESDILKKTRSVGTSVSPNPRLAIYPDAKRRKPRRRTKSIETISRKQMQQAMTFALENGTLSNEDYLYYNLNLNPEFRTRAVSVTSHRDILPSFYQRILKPRESDRSTDTTAFLGPCLIGTWKKIRSEGVLD